jgi:hypothetical protein
LGTEYVDHLPESPQPRYSVRTLGTGLPPRSSAAWVRDSSREFELCGRAEPGSAGHRRISHAFAERALSTAAAPRALGRERAFVRRRFADVWRYILERTPIDPPPPP